MSAGNSSSKTIIFLHMDLPPAGRRGAVQVDRGQGGTSTGCPVCLVLKQGAVNQLFFEVFLMFLACLDSSRWAKFHLGMLGPQE